jgi:hypothetical protein
VDLQQCRSLARIQESLEMRERLADWSRFVHLAHKTPYSESRDWLKSPCRLKVGCGVRLRSTDFESIHYSTGVSLRVMGGRKHIRIETVQDAFAASLNKSFFSFRSQELLNKCLKCIKRIKRLEVLLGTFREFNGTEQWLRSATWLLAEGSIDRCEIFPSIYVRNLN